MDLETLQLFVVVAEQGSFTRASIKLGITQPALSRQIQRLESEFGAELLYRHGRGVVLTDHGKRLLSAAETVLKQLTDVKEELSGADLILRGVVSLGLPPSLVRTLAVPLIRAVRTRLPEARLKVIVGFSGNLLEWLDNGRLDIAVLYDARRSRTMLVKPLLRENLYLVSAREARKLPSTATVADLGQGPLALSSISNGMRRIVERAASEAGVEIDVAVEIDSVEALKLLVEQGPERTVLPFGAVHREVRDGRLTARRFTARNMQALLVTATPLHRHTTKLSKTILAMIEDEVERCVEVGTLTGTPGTAGDSVATDSDDVHFSDPPS